MANQDEEAKASKVVDVSSSSRKERARGRWKILQRALLSKAAASSNAENNHHHQASIHRFGGYRMLPDSKPVNAELQVKLCRELQRIHLDNDDDDDEIINNLTEKLEVSLLALLALDMNHTTGTSSSFSFQFVCAAASSKNRSKILGSLESLQCNLRTRCGLETCRIAAAAATDTDAAAAALIGVDLTIAAPCSPLLDYRVREYQVNSTTCILTRERTVFRPHLAELVKSAIDNTGNVCIWDSEKTLTWALLQEEEDQSAAAETTVLELGVGMAGLAALSLAAAQHNNKKKVLLTDGHASCAQNNRVNVALMQAAGMLLPAAQFDIQSQVLVWSSSSSASSIKPTIQADLTLVSDCTHFQEYHACLFWTMVQNTRVGGTIWMCQPNRGNSLQRFLNLIEHVNDATALKILEIQERRYSRLSALHEQFQQDPSYDANIHQARIFCLTKLRDETDQDRVHAVEHMAQRDAP